MSHIMYWQISGCFWKTYSSVEETNILCILCKYMGRKRQPLNRISQDGRLVSYIQNEENPET